MEKILSNELYFAKLRDDAQIPCKEDTEAGYDVYACFDEDFIEILPSETKLIPTGICSVFSKDYVAILKERGSTGSKGMAQRCGVVDSSYRGEWFCPITNVGTKPLIISKSFVEWHDEIKNSCVIYPYEKAICQAVMTVVPKMEVSEISVEELRAFESKRGCGALGSSGK